MKQNTLTILALGATLLTAGFVLGQSQPAGKAPGPAPAAKQQKLVKVATLNTVQANQEFQNNVQVLQAERQSVIEQSAAVEKERDEKKKKDLKTKLDAALAKLNVDNAAMQKVYGFSLTRNYTLEIEKANIYMLVTDEEAVKLEQAQKAAAPKK